MDVTPSNNKHIDSLEETIESSHSSVEESANEPYADSHTPKEPAISAVEGPSSTDLIKIQELLIGNQLRAVNQKIMLIHKDFKQSISDMEKKLELKMQQQEELLNQNLQGIREQLNSQASLHEEQNFELRAQVNAVEESHCANQQLIDTQLRDTTSSLETLIEGTHQELLEKFDGSMNNLRSNQLDRFALSDLLTGIADQIRTTDNIPTVTQHAEHISVADAANSDSPDSESA